MQAVGFRPQGNTHGPVQGASASVIMVKKEGGGVDNELSTGWGAARTGETPTREVRPEGSPWVWMSVRRLSSSSSPRRLAGSLLSTLAHHHCVSVLLVWRKPGQEARALRDEQRFHVEQRLNSNQSSQLRVKGLGAHLWTHVHSCVCG